MAKNQYTKIEDVGVVCNDCGSFGDTPEKVLHHKTCQAGESKKWKAHYNKPEEDTQRIIK